MSKVSDEKTKLLANTLDRASTACLALGVVAPLAAAFYAIEPDRRADGFILVLGALIWLAVAIGLHLTARWILNRLDP